MDELKQRWQNLEFNKKIATITFALFVVLGTSFISFYLTKEDYSALVSDGKLSEDEVEVIEQHLEQLHVPFKTTRKNGIYIPTNKIESIKSDLSDYLPKAANAKGYELFDSSTWIKGEKELQILELRALKGQLENDLTQFENIKGATVILDIAPTKTFGPSPYQTKASVILHLKSHTRLTASQIAAITSHVMGAVRGLTANRIAISDTTGKLYQSISPEGSPIVSTSDNKLFGPETLLNMMTLFFQNFLHKNNTTENIQAIIDPAAASIDRENFNTLYIVITVLCGLLLLALWTICHLWKSDFKKKESKLPLANFFKNENNLDPIASYISILEKESPQEIVRNISQQDDKTLAQLLAHLKPKRVVEIIQLFPQDRQASLIENLTHLDDKYFTNGSSAFATECLILLPSTTRLFILKKLSQDNEKQKTEKAGFNS